MPQFSRAARVVLFLGLLLCGQRVESVRAAEPTVIISELAWAGSEFSSADEWIELHNVTDHPLDLAGWSLTKKSSGQEKPMYTIPAGIIPVGGYFLISHVAPGIGSALLRTPDIVSTDISLVNSSLQVKVYDATGGLIDAADDGGGAPLAGKYDSSAKIFATMERNPRIEDGTLATSWHTASAQLGLVEGATGLGTPGNENSNAGPVAVGGDDQSAVVGESVSFDASRSTDPERDTLSYHWDFGDGSTADLATVSHLFTMSGTFSVIVTVSDGKAFATDSLIVTVADVAVVPVTPEPTVRPCAGWIIVSILPNPVGADDHEEVVLKNVADTAQAPKRCTLRIGTRSWSLSAIGDVEPQKTMAIQHAAVAIRIPNTGATVTVLDEHESVIDETTYSVAAEDARWVRGSKGWAWDKKPTPKKQTAKKKITPRVVEHPRTVAELQNFSSGTMVSVRATSTTPVGAMGERVVILEDATGGVSVTLATAHPTIPLGSSVSVVGTVRTRDGRRYILADAGGVRVGIGSARSPRAVTVVDVTSDDTNRLVTLSGVITVVSGSRFEVDDGTDIISTVVKSSTGIVRPRMAAGDHVVVIGVVSAGASGIKLYPRVREDIVVQRVLGAQTSSTPEALASSTQPLWWYWVAAIVGALMISMRPLWKYWRRTRSA